MSATTYLVIVVLHMLREHLARVAKLHRLGGIVVNLNLVNLGTTAAVVVVVATVAAAAASMVDDVAVAMLDLDEIR